eukprot:Rmarinus@m.25781
MAAGSRGQQLLSLFWDLAAVEAEAREKAAAALLSALKESESPEDVDYCLNRLVRGLASSRDAARQGFTLALTGLLRAYPSIQTSVVFEKKVDFLQPHGNLKPQEERDLLFGRTFLLVVLVRAGRLSPSNDPGAEWGKRVIKELLAISKKKIYFAEMCFSVIGLVCKQVTQSTFNDELYPVLEHVLCVEAASLGPHGLALALDLAAHFKIGEDSRCVAWCGVPISDKSMISKFVSPLKESSCSHPRMHCVWNHVLSSLGDPLTPSAGADVATSDHLDCAHHSIKTKRLKALWKVVEADLAGSSQERKYLAFLLFRRLLPQLKPSQIPVLFSHDLMRIIITNCAKKDNYLHKAARALVDDIVSVGKTDMDLRLSLISQLVGPEGDRRWDAATHTTTLASLVGGLDVNAAETYITDLKKKYIEASPSLFVEAAASLAKEGRSKAGGVEESQRLCDAERVWAIDTIATVARVIVVGKDAEGDGEKPAANASNPARREVITSTLQFLLKQGFFDVGACAGSGLGEDGAATKSKGGGKKKAKAKEEQPEDPLAAGPAASKTVRAAATARFLTLLADATVHSRDYLWQAVQACVDLRKAGVEPFLPQDAEADEARADAYAALKLLYKQVQADPTSAGAAKEKAGFFTLLAELYLLSLSRPSSSQDSKDALSASKELIELEKALLERRSKRRKGGASGAGASEDEEREEGLRALTDVLLSLLTLSSAPLRAAVKNTFVAIVPHLPASALELLINVVSAQSSTEDEEGVFGVASKGAGDDEDDVDDDDDEGSSDDSDGMASDNEDDSDGSASSDDEELPDAKKKNKGKGKGANAKSTGNDAKKGRKAQADSDDDEDEESGSGDEDDDDVAVNEDQLAKMLMDDDAVTPTVSGEEMFGLDKAMAQYFKSLQDKKKEAKETKEQILHFKFRVLDLLEVYVRKMGSHINIVGLLLSLLQAYISLFFRAESHNDRSLCNRVESILRRLVRTRGPRPQDDEGTCGPRDSAAWEAVSDAVQELGKLATKGFSGEIRELVLVSYAFAVRCAVGSEQDSCARVALMSVGSLLEAFLNGKKDAKSLSSAFFVQMLQRSPALTETLSPAIVRLLQTTEKPYLRSEGVQILQHVVRTTDSKEPAEAVLSALKDSSRTVAKWCEGGSLGKPQYAAGILRYLASLAQLQKKMSEGGEDVIARDPVVSAVQHYASSDEANRPKLRGACKTTLAALGVAAEGGNKTKAEKQREKRERREERKRKRAEKEKEKEKKKASTGGKQENGAASDSEAEGEGDSGASE